MYETRISASRWMVYDIPGNIGWILYLIGYGRFIVKSGFTQHLIASILLTIPVILLVIAIAELASERIAKLDRILPAVRLWRGFGAITISGALGAVLVLLTFGSNISMQAFCRVLLRCRQEERLYWLLELQYRIFPKALLFPWSEIRCTAAAGC